MVTCIEVSQNINFDGIINEIVNLHLSDQNENYDAEFPELTTKPKTAKACNKLPCPFKWEAQQWSEVLKAMQ